MPLDDSALDLLFREARTHNKWTDQPVTDDELRAVFDLLKMGPTSANCSPARFLFLRTQEAKEKLRPALSAGNVDKTMAAPVTAIVALRPAFLRPPAEAVPARRRQKLVQRQLRPRRRKRRSATARCRAAI